MRKPVGESFFAIKRPNQLDKNAVWNSGNIMWALLAGFGLAALGYLLLGIYSGVNYWYDGFLRWQESAYVLKGVNPFDVMTGKSPVIDSIGSLSRAAGTVPWAYLISNLILPGFLPWSIAKVYSMVVCTALTLLAARQVWLYAQKQANGVGSLYSARFVGAICALACLALFPLLSGFKQGNHSLVITAALVIAMTLDPDEHPWLSVCCLVLASMKPQVSALFFIPYIIKRKWKVLFVSGGIIAAAWAVVSLRTGASPIALLAAIFGQSDFYVADNTPFVYYGLLDALVWTGAVKSSLLLVVQMGAGFAVCALLCFLYRQANLCTLFSVCAVISTMWSYSHTFDLQVLCILSVALLMRAFATGESSAYSVAALGFAVFLVLPIRQQWYSISFVLPLAQRLIFVAALVLVLRRPIPGQKSVMAYKN